MKNLLIKISLTFLIIAPGVCSAAQPMFTTYPLNTVDQNKWIIADINPGGEIKGKIAVVNLSEQEITLDLSVKDSTENDQQYKIIENENKEISTWTKLSQNQIKLNPKEKTTVDYSIKPPQETKEKQYTGAILVSYTEDNSSLKVSSRIGNRIYLNVTNNSDLQSNLVNNNLSTNNYILIIASCLSLFLIFNSIRKQKYETKSIN